MKGLSKDTIIMRGFKDFDDAEDMLTLMDDYYNFVNPHMSLSGKTPAEEAEN